MNVTKTDSKGSRSRRVEQWRIEVTAGPCRGLVLRRGAGIVRIGSAPTNDIGLTDEKVSRQHAEVELDPLGPKVRDLGSKNGTWLDGSRIESATLPLEGAVLVVCSSEIAVTPDDQPIPLAPSTRQRCGRLRGRSEAMRRLFAQIERIATGQSTVLVHGETGTGKELVAEALHDLGARSRGPFVVVDCGAIARELVESELFGHVRGAFTGATTDRRGAFREASGGTLLLDEIGELPLETQPRLLRALEKGEVKPVGAAEYLPADVRIVAASHRDLAQEVAEGRFRQDLYYRLSVVVLDVPPLRHHLEDVPSLVGEFLRDLDAPPFETGSLETLSGHDWPGNVRQLRNVVERAVALAGGGPPTVRPADLAAASARVSPADLLRLPFKDAKEELLSRFTRDYLVALLDRNRGNVSAAAREAQIDRNWIVALARRLGVRVRD